MSVVYFLLEIADNGDLTTYVNTEEATGSTPVSSADWTLVTVTFALHPLDTTHFMMISVGESSSITGLAPVKPIFAYNSKNLVRIGGPGSFLGSIYGFRIYSPGSSLVLNKGKKKYHCKKLFKFF